MMGQTRRDLLRQVISHDGVTDSLTGLMAFPSFQVNAIREMASAAREKRDLNLFLITLAEIDESGTSSPFMSPTRNLLDLGDDEVLAFADRMLQGANVLQKEFRLNDLLARYTFADFILLNTGTYEVISEKLAEYCRKYNSLFAGTKIDFRELANSPSSLSFEGVLGRKIAIIEEAISR